MAEEKKTTSSTKKTTKKSTTKTASTRSSLAKNADAERARKEALREEVLALYSKKQGNRVADEKPGNNDMANDLANESSVNTEEVASVPSMKNAYTTPFFGTNKADAISVSSLEENGLEETKTEVDDMTAGKEVKKIGSFEEFSKSNYNNDSLDSFDAGNYVGLSQKPQKTKIISEKSYNRSPKFEKFKRFLSYLFTTKEGWYYILGTLCLVFIIVLFFI